MHAWEGTDCLDHGPASGRSFPRPPGGLPRCMRHEYDGARLPGAQERPAPRPPPLPPVAERRRPSASRYVAGTFSRRRLGAVGKTGYRRTPWDLRSASVVGFYAGSKPSRHREQSPKTSRASHRHAVALNNLSRTFPTCPCNKPARVGLLCESLNLGRSVGRPKSGNFHMRQGGSYWSITFAGFGNVRRSTRSKKKPLEVDDEIYVRADALGASQWRRLRMARPTA